MTSDHVRCLIDIDHHPLQVPPPCGPVYLVLASLLPACKLELYFKLLENQSQTCIISIDAASERALRRVRTLIILQDNLSLRSNPFVIGVTPGDTYCDHERPSVNCLKTRLNLALIRENFEGLFARSAVNSECFMSHKFKVQI